MAGHGAKCYHFGVRRSAAPLHAALLRWYRRAKRDLPWRRDPTPYRVWVSEIMLQQTTVAAVTPKYEAFLRRFPDPAALAAAPEEDVLSHWAGLGYYSRARNLHRAAAAIMTEHGGRIPADFDAILSLPGVGRYTAGAVLSIALGKPYPVVDGNVIRVLSRLLGMPGRTGDPAFVRTIWSEAEKILSREKPGDWNQALMELGATLCSPRAPSCDACPLTGHCVAFQKNLQSAFPEPNTPRQSVRVRWTCLWIEKNRQVLLWRRSSKERLLKNLWGFPEAERLRATNGAPIAHVDHSITCHRLSVELRTGVLRNGAPLPREAHWVPRRELPQRLVSSLWRKLLRFV